MAWAEEQSWFGLEDLVINNNQEQERIKNNFLKKDIWTTKFDDTIHISKMDNNHLKNCINKCKRDSWRMYALPKLEKELKSRVNMENNNIII
jgi:hypothetical protein